MKPSIPSIGMHILRKGLMPGLTCGALAALSPAAQAEDPVASIAQVTVSAPVVKVVGLHRDLTPREQTTVTATVAFDPITLTTNSGVALLKDRVAQAARKVCADADPEDIEDDDQCVLKAIRGSDAQIDAAVAAAKKT
jgi:UrcA family protein